MQDATVSVCQSVLRLEEFGATSLAALEIRSNALLGFRQRGTRVDSRQMKQNADLRVSRCYANILDLIGP